MSGGYVRQQRPMMQGSGGEGYSMAAFEQRLENKIDGLSNKMETLTAQVASMMPRSEVDAEIARRVSAETYASDQRATNERLLRLEASPMKFLAYLGAISGCLGVLSASLISIIGITVGIVEYIVTHH